MIKLHSFVLLVHLCSYCVQLFEVYPWQRVNHAQVLSEKPTWAIKKIHSGGVKLYININNRHLSYTYRLKKYVYFKCITVIYRKNYLSTVSHATHSLYDLVYVTICPIKYTVTFTITYD